MHVSVVPNVAAEPVQYVIDTKRWFAGSHSHMRENCVVRLCQVSKGIADSHLVAAANNPRESPRVNCSRILPVSAHMRLLP